MCANYDPRSRSRLNWAAIDTDVARAIRFSIAAKWTGRLGTTLEDLLQDLIIVQARAASSFNPDRGNLPALLYTACLNRCRDIQRNKIIEKRHLTSLKNKPSKNEYQETEFIDLVNDLKELSLTKTEEIVVMDLIETKDRRATAERLGMTKNALRLILHRLRKKL